MAHLHLDPLGGIAGDMFAAALSELDPTLADGLLPLLRSAGLDEAVAVSFVAHRDDVFVGRRFVVDDPKEKGQKVPGRFVLQKGMDHHHVPLQEILRQLSASGLTTGAKARAVDIFQRVAVAEAAVHGVDLKDVAFHEVGAQDSVADVVAAAVLLDRLEHKHGAFTSSTASLPLGSGRVHTAHGELPVPAPATLRLLDGLAVHDDGRLGERVTPTGAAILRHLQPGKRAAGVVGGSGVGFGTKVFPGLSNILRVTLTTTPTTTTTTPSTSATTSAWQERPLAVLSAEIDDMSGEELGRAADALRDVEGVVDVSFLAVTMKKGRPATRMQVLALPERKDACVAAFFAQTSTLGIRVDEVVRCELGRAVARVAVDDATAGRVKVADRPGGATAKADIDDVEGTTLAERRALRQALEQKK